MLARFPFFNFSEPMVRSMVIGTWVPSSGSMTLSPVIPALLARMVEYFPLEEVVSWTAMIQIPVVLLLR
jgi:hypothetical protein